MKKDGQEMMGDLIAISAFKYHSIGLCKPMKSRRTALGCLPALSNHQPDPSHSPLIVPVYATIKPQSCRCLLVPPSASLTHLPARNWGNLKMSGLKEGFANFDVNV